MGKPEKHFGSEMRRLRREKGFSMAFVAKKIGVSVQYIHAVETGKKPPPLDRQKQYEMARAATGDPGDAIGLCGLPTVRGRKFTFDADKLPTDVSVLLLMTIELAEKLTPDQLRRVREILTENHHE